LGLLATINRGIVDTSWTVENRVTTHLYKESLCCLATMATMFSYIKGIGGKGYTLYIRNYRGHRGQEHTSLGMYKVQTGLSAGHDSQGYRGQKRKRGGPTTSPEKSQRPKQAFPVINIMLLTAIALRIW
tara:strand:- start:1506 stop:1892 length:387 start_codon:yes stop_codon:yes gene_type:complete